MRRENTYETPSFPADVESLQKTMFIIKFILAVLAITAVLTAGVAVYAATRNVNDSGTHLLQSNGMTTASSSTTTTTITSTTTSGSACSKVSCENEGTCIDIYPDNYVCVCVATFYGRNCEHGETIIFKSIMRSA